MELRELKGVEDKDGGFGVKAKLYTLQIGETKMRCQVSSSRIKGIEKRQE
jgi:hypothetical protein